MLLKILAIIWIDEIVDKIAMKHNVAIEEVEEVLHYRPQIRFLEKGDRKNEDVYVALGQTESGRYLAIMFIYKPLRNAVLILSAREMTHKERILYGKTKKR
jgi:uncharacterized DUF497 family protein